MPLVYRCIMTWGWTGRNTVPSKALLKGPTTATSDMELKYLETQLTKPPAWATEQLVAARYVAALPFVEKEKLAGYKEGADAELQDEFAHFLSGNNDKFIVGNGDVELEFAEVPFVTPWDRTLVDRRLANTKLTVLTRVKQQKIPWRNRSLLHIPGAHAYLTRDIIKRRELLEHCVHWPRPRPNAGRTAKLRRKPGAKPQ